MSDIHPDVDSETVFIVYGLRGKADPTDGSTMIDLEVIGVMRNLADAQFLADYYEEMDTTLEGVNIVSAESYDDPPEMDVMLYYSVDEEEEIVYIRSSCVVQGTQPQLRIDTEARFCSSLSNPEHEEHMTSYFMNAVEKVYGFTPRVVRQLSPEAERILSI